MHAKAVPGRQQEPPSHRPESDVHFEVARWPVGGHRYLLAGGHGARTVAITEGEQLGALHLARSLPNAGSEFIWWSARVAAYCGAWRTAAACGARGGRRKTVRAVWYERQEPADEVLQAGELLEAKAGPDEVRVRVTRSGVNPGFPFWPMLFDNVTIRLLGSVDFPAAAKQQAAADLTAAARDGALSIAIDAPLPLEQAAQAHDRVDEGARGRILLVIPD